MDDDELAKLMREIEQFDNPGTPTQPSTPAPTQPSSEVARTDSPGAGGKGKWVAISAVGGGITGAVIGGFLWFLPGVDALSTGLGAALGGAIVALVGKPPKWLD